MTHTANHNLTADARLSRDDAEALAFDRIAASDAAHAKLTDSGNPACVRGWCVHVTDRPAWPGHPAGMPRWQTGDNLVAYKGERVTINGRWYDQANPAAGWSYELYSGAEYDEGRRYIGWVPEADLIALVPVTDPARPAFITGYAPADQASRDLSQTPPGRHPNPMLARQREMFGPTIGEQARARARGAAR